MFRAYACALLYAATMASESFAGEACVDVAGETRADAARQAVEQATAAAKRLPNGCVLLNGAGEESWPTESSSDSGSVIYRACYRSPCPAQREYEGSRAVKDTREETGDG